MLKETGASDLHLSSGSQPLVRLAGRLERIKYKVLEEQELATLLYEIAPQRLIAAFEETGDLDFAYAAPGIGRFRANYFRQERGLAAAFRAIPEAVPSLGDLGLPDILAELALRPKGLVLVTGPTGSGKSTTLAAMLATAKIGAAHVFVFAGYSAKFLRERLNETRCRLLVTADGFYRGGRLISLKPVVDEALLGTRPDVAETVILVRRTGGDIDLQEPRDRYYHDLIRQEAPEAATEIMKNESVTYF